MPELAEVEYYRKQWSPGLEQKVVSVDVNSDKRLFRDVDTLALVKNLPGQQLMSSHTHGKQMLFVFGSQHWLGIHLGMTGKTSTQKKDYEATKHDHLVINLKLGLKLVLSDPRIFGKVRYTQSSEPPDWWSNLPPAVLSEAFTEARLEDFLQRRSRAPIKAVLLMQETFPGVGNWMADEILWRARLHPGTRCGAIKPKQRRELYHHLGEVCRDALKVIGSDWGKPPDNWLFNHRWKDGGICPKTQCSLVRETIGGRTTCWSPDWQGGPS